MKITKSEGTYFQTRIQFNFILFYLNKNKTMNFWSFKEQPILNFIFLPNEVIRNAVIEECMNKQGSKMMGAQEVIDPALTNARSSAPQPGVCSRKQAECM